MSLSAETSASLGSTAPALPAVLPTRSIAERGGEQGAMQGDVTTRPCIGVGKFVRPPDPAVRNMNQCSWIGLAIPANPRGEE